MRPLPLHDWGDGVRLRVQCALLALPTAFAAAGFGLTYPFAVAMARALDIPDDAPVNSQPNGAWWLASFATALCAFPAGGYVLGFVADALALRWFFGWPAARVRDVFLHSRLPPDWYIDDWLARLREAAEDDE